VDVRFEPLDSKRHDRGAFSCGHEQLDRYLKTVAAQASERLTAQTFVLVESNVDAARLQPILGFDTLTLLVFRDADMDPATARALKIKNVGTIPAVLLGHFAVAKHVQGKGLGLMLLRHALRAALQSAHTVGGVMVVTDPIDESAARFYEKYGFTQLIATSPRLYLPMKTVARSFPAVDQSASPAS